MMMMMMMMMMMVVLHKGVSKKLAEMFYFFKAG